MEIRKGRSEALRGEVGYSWLYHSTALNGGLRVIVAVLVIGLATGLFVWYWLYGGDASPDSPLGYAYAIIGTILLLLAATAFTIRRRSHKRRRIGGLRSALGWHMAFALMGLAFLCMHSFGELNLRSGTYALYGMIVLVISGLIGRLLDRLMPRLMAASVHQALTAHGEDRIESISQKLQAIVGHNKQSIRSFIAPNAEQKMGVPNDSPVPAAYNQNPKWRGQTMVTPWDLAYISLESTPQELSRESGQYRFVPDKKSGLLRPGGLMPGTREQMGELNQVRRAMQYEQLYRYITFYWRRFHILLALITVGLLIWHIVYALQILFPTWGH